MAQSGIYDDSIVIDGLNVSNWDSRAVFDSLSNGRVTAINATNRRLGGVPRDPRQHLRLDAQVQRPLRHPVAGQNGR